MILILAGIVAAYSLLAGRSSAASMGADDLQIQTVEQERMVTTYFRVLSWLSAVSEHETFPKPTAPQRAAAMPGATIPQSTWRPVKISLCAFRSARDFATSRIRSHLLN